MNPFTWMIGERARLVYEAEGSFLWCVVLVNDHDPKPLYYQFAERAGAFTWQPLEEGPEVCRIAIGKPST